MLTVDYSLGYKLARKNFKKLYSASRQSYLSGSYGIACSLNVLACEELIKSFVLHLKYLHPETDFKDSEKIFRNHQFKHNELKEVLTVAHEGIKLFQFSILEDKEAFLSILPTEKVEEYRKEYDDIERVRRRTEVIRQSKTSVDDIINWLNQANTEKNLGLYVGLDKQNNWQRPDSFNKKQYKKEIRFTSLLKLHIQNAIDIFRFMKELKVRGEAVK